MDNQTLSPLLESAHEFLEEALRELLRGQAQFCYRPRSNGNRTRTQRTSRPSESSVDTKKY